jgi:hypothetical protein
VADDAVAVTREPNVEFKAVTTVGEGQVECCKRVFRSVTARAAMAKQQRTRVSSRQTRLAF